MLCLPTIASSMSGKLGGIVASHNRGGQYFRTRTVPVNPSSAAQQVVRGILGSLASRWSSTLTATEREEWANYANAVTVVNRIGETIQLSGVNWYVAGNSLLSLAGGTVVDQGPSVLSLADLSEPTFAALSAGSGDFTVAFDDSDPWANETGSYLLIFASRPTPAGRSRPIGGYRYAGQVDGDDSTAPTSPATITAPFPIDEGQRVFFRAVAVTADGRKSPEFLGNALVGA